MSTNDKAANLIPGANPGGRPRTKPLTDRMRWQLGQTLERGSELVELVAVQLGGPVPEGCYGRKVGEVLAELEVAAALAGDGGARARIWDRIEGKVTGADLAAGLTVVISTNVGSDDADAARVIDGTGFRIELEDGAE